MLTKATQDESPKVSLVVADVDGTLVNRAKELLPGPPRRW